jgi:GTP-sensing pleiotropic transcriptional regulator CodY
MHKHNICFQHKTVKCCQKYKKKEKKRAMPWKNTGNSLNKTEYVTAHYSRDKLKFKANHTSISPSVGVNLRVATKNSGNFNKVHFK